MRRPHCDIHRISKNEIVPAIYDGKTQNGPWAFMCEECFKVYGVGVGLGLGQKLKGLDSEPQDEDVS